MLSQSEVITVLNLEEASTDGKEEEMKKALAFRHSTEDQLTDSMYSIPVS